MYFDCLFIADNVICNCPISASMIGLVGRFNIASIDAKVFWETVEFLYKYSSIHSSALLFAKVF